MFICLQWVLVSFHVHVQAHCLLCHNVAYILVLSIRLSRGAASSFQNLWVPISCVGNDDHSVAQTVINVDTWLSVLFSEHTHNATGLVCSMLGSSIMTSADMFTKITSFWIIFPTVLVLQHEPGNCTWQGWWYLKHCPSSCPSQWESEYVQAYPQHAPDVEIWPRSSAGSSAHGFTWGVSLILSSL
jgi:hypothetical protein